MNLHLPVYRRLWSQAKAENRRLRDDLVRMRGDLMQERLDAAVDRARAYNATARANALEKANDELRSDLCSWMGRAVSDG